MLITIIIVGLVVLSIFCLCYIFYLKYFKVYTRERFAFVGLTFIATLAASLLMQIFSGEGCVSAFIKTSNLVFDTSLSTYKTDLKDYIIAVIIFFILAQLIYKLHTNWNGPISENLYDKLRFNQNSTIFSEAALQLKDFISEKPLIVPHIKNEKDKEYFIFSQYEEEKMPWYQNVSELLSLSDRQFKINIESDFFSTERCFISKYGRGQYTAILCTQNFPQNTEIDDFVFFAKKQKNNIDIFIIAVKNLAEPSYKIKHSGVEITIRSEEEMLNNLIDFSDYEHYIMNQFTSKEVTASTNITLNEIYVPLHGTTYDSNNIGEVEEYVNNWLSESTFNKHLGILGEYGCGKSVLSLKIAYNLLKNKDTSSRIPILIELRGKSPRNLSAIEILSTWGANFRIEAASLLKLHRAGKLLIIFEGFDEMDMIGDREMRLNHFQKLWEFAIPKSKIIITGRPNFFLDDKELKVNLGIDKPYEDSHFCEAIYLQKFTNEQIKSALRNIDLTTRNQVLEIVDNENNKNFYDLISRPSILFLVALIWKERKLEEIKDKINSAVIISEFIKYSYSRQENKKIAFPLSEYEREYFMLGISVGMLRVSEYSNQITKNDLEDIILKLYRNFPEEISSHQTALQLQRRSLKERMKDNNQAEDTVLTDVRSCGILVNDITRKDYFKFAHKSFLEYQVSFFYVESILQDKGQYNLVVNSIANSLNISISQLPHSPETISFTAEILIAKLNLSKNDDPNKVAKELLGLIMGGMFRKNPSLGALLDLLWNLMPHTLGVNLLRSITFQSSTKLNLLLVPNTLKRGVIWLKCCKQLGISNEILSSVVPQIYINYLEGTPDEMSDALDKVVQKLIELNYITKK